LRELLTSFASLKLRNEQWEDESGRSLLRLPSNRLMCRVKDAHQRGTIFGLHIPKNSVL